MILNAVFIVRASKNARLSIVPHFVAYFKLNIAHKI
jgi:hypothetical protein